MSRVFHWITQRREKMTVLQTEIAERRPMLMNIGDIIKVLSLAGAITWGAAGLVTKINAHESALKEDRLAIVTIQSNISELKGEVHAMYQVIVPPRRH